MSEALATESGTRDPENLTDVRTREEALSRTWEMELLISGGLVFSLFQLSSALDGGFRRIEPHLSVELMMGAAMGYQIVKVILYALIGSFALHLLARAYWIGLVGLHSVFPGGVRWEEVTSGPISKRVNQELAPPLPRLIGKTNDFCSTIFSFAFLIVLAFAAGLLWTAPALLIAYLASRFASFEDPIQLIFLSLALVAVLPVTLSILALVDKYYGSRLNPSGRMARTIEKALRGWTRMPLELLYRTITLVLVTNVRKRTIYSFLYLGMGALFLLFVVKDLWRVGDDFSSSSYLPEERGGHSLDAAYYEDRWPEGRIITVPSIQDDILEEPYIRLFIPYDPIRHDAVLGKRCPQVSAEAPERVLRCLADFHRVALDGKAMPRLGLRFYTHPRSGVRGMLAYIPTAGLARGEHLLRVEAVPGRRAKTPPKPHLIRFWI